MAANWSIMRGATAEAGMVTGALIDSLIRSEAKEAAGSEPAGDRREVEESRPEPAVRLWSPWTDAAMKALLRR